MNVQEVILSLQKVILVLKDAWVVKLIASFLITFLVSEQGQLLLIFTALVFLDLFTKWIALSRKCLDDKEAKQKGLASCIYNIPAAMTAGYIKSEPMRKRFLGKFLWYLLIAILASVLDINLVTLGDNQYFVKLFITYMGVSEAISILENLREAGVEQASGLLDIVKIRRKGIK